MIKLPPVVVIELAVTASGKAPVTTYPDESVPRIGASVIVVFRVPVHRTAPEVIELHEMAGTLNVAPVGATLSATTVAQYIAISITEVFARFIIVIININVYITI
ncbi:hypothetical protein PAPYR_10692 [Paratrimastix pyriformis]|uniref:Uncharacterized protein n=1 Tax=Paratrimastix pyriformis TaxID=342808 RepID=A0ABQ8U5D8_9EUKA|nr:hypothetical protein PAPYR_10692 [Paratrimastix pyriformis]